MRKPCASPLSFLGEPLLKLLLRVKAGLKNQITE